MSASAALVAGVAAGFGGFGFVAGYLLGQREGHRDGWASGTDEGWRLGLERGRQDACAQLTGCALRDGHVTVHVDMSQPSQTRTLSATRDELLKASTDLKMAADAAWKDDSQ